MGKRLIVQARGAGGPRYRAPSHRYKVRLRYRAYDSLEKESKVKAKVVDIIHDSARSAPVAILKYENGEQGYMLACEGLAVGDEIECGAKAEIKQGNVLPLASIPEGTMIYNIEVNAGDGGKLVRSAGSYAVLIAHDNNNSLVQLPSGAIKTLASKCRATIGIVAGGGRKDRPMLKAGKKHHALRSKPRVWPRVRGRVMNIVDHPYGGGNKKVAGKPVTVSRNAPPGRKVGLIAAKRTGKQ